jgi:hypothetical protein
VSQSRERSSVAPTSLLLLLPRPPNISIRPPLSPLPPFPPSRPSPSTYPLGAGLELEVLLGGRGGGRGRNGACGRTPCGRCHQPTSGLLMKAQHAAGACGNESGGRRWSCECLVCEVEGPKLPQLVEMSDERTGAAGESKAGDPNEPSAASSSCSQWQYRRLWIACAGGGVGLCLWVKKGTLRERVRPDVGELAVVHDDAREAIIWLDDAHGGLARPNKLLRPRFHTNNSVSPRHGTYYGVPHTGLHTCSDGAVYQAGARTSLVGYQ